MKVDDPRISQLAAQQELAAQAAKAAQEARGAEEAGRKAPSQLSDSSDSVRLSGDLRLADAAVRLAAVAGDVRPEAVARARALLESGKLGDDPERLADRLIDTISDRDAERT
jgi:anti-sigma28 factor (negative regulator of flagellin synthesis)